MDLERHVDRDWFASVESSAVLLSHGGLPEGVVKDIGCAYLVAGHADQELGIAESICCALLVAICVAEVKLHLGSIDFVLFEQTGEVGAVTEIGECPLEVAVQSIARCGPPIWRRGSGKYEGFFYVSFERHDLWTQHSRHARLTLSRNAFTTTNICATSSTIDISFRHEKLNTIFFDSDLRWGTAIYSPTIQKLKMSIYKLKI